MAIADLKNVLNIFGGSELSEGQQSELFKEVLVMTLARAADADINIQTVEVDRIREIIKEHTGEDISAADIRVAARSELYAEATLRKYLRSVRSKMAARDRAETLNALADVFRISAYPVSEGLRGLGASSRLMRLGSWGVIGVELAFPLSLAHPLLLGAALCIATLFHTANACLFGLNRFLWAWLAAFPSLIWFQDRLLG